MCSGMVLFIIKRDKKGIFRFAALQSEAGKKLVRHHSPAEERKDTVYYLREGVFYTKSAAILHILRDLGRGWQIPYFLIRIPAPIRDFFYTLVARYRYRLFGKKTSCLIPNQEVNDRFIG